MSFTVWLESFRIAWREMFRHRMRSTLTMLGVIFGVAAIIIVVSISQAAKLTILGQISNLGTNMLIITPGSTSVGGVQGGSGSGSSLTMKDVEAIGRECSAIRYSAGVNRTVAQVVSELANWSVPVTGATAQYLDVRSWPVELGRPIEPRDVDGAAKVAVIGKTTANQLFGSGDPIGQRVRIKGTPMTIIGLLASKGQSPLGDDQDDTMVVPITTAFRYLSGGDRPNAMVASAVSEDDIPLAMTQVTELLRQRHHVRAGELDDFTVKNLEEHKKTAEETSNVMTILLMSIAGVSLMVGGVGIMNIMLVTVMERTREIGIRMALGASRQMIMQQFMIEAATLAGVGGLAGVLMGILGANAISRLTGWWASFTPPLLILPVVFALVVGMLFGWLPARRASSLSPVESLRHE